MMTGTRHHEQFQPHFEALERLLNGGAATPLHALRREAFSRFMDLGFPTVKDEEWRFTNVAPIARTAFTPSLRPADTGLRGRDLHRFTFGGLRCTRLVFVNGHSMPFLSGGSFLPSGVVVTSLADALRSDTGLLQTHLTRLAASDGNSFTALNTAFLLDGAFISVPDNVEVVDPIHLLFVTAGGTPGLAAHPRTLIVTGRGSRVSIVESYVHLQNEAYLTNAVTEIVVGQGAVVEHDKLQQEGEKAFHVGTIHIRQEAASTYTANSITLGGSITRNSVTAVLAGERCECTLNGLSLGTGEQLVDNHTTIDHAMPHCASHELYKAVLDGRSRGVFNGKIFVRKDAQKTDAKQTNKTLLLSDGATIDTKPQLEIFADDVKCTHGATVGALDDEQVFYLRSRGIGEVEARDILTFAFAGDVIGRIHVAPLREQLEHLMHHRLRQGRVTPDSDDNAR